MFESAWDQRSSWETLKSMLSPLGNASWLLHNADSLTYLWSKDCTEQCKWKEGPAKHPQAPICHGEVPLTPWERNRDTGMSWIIRRYRLQLHAFPFQNKTKTQIILHIMMVDNQQAATWAQWVGGGGDLFGTHALFRQTEKRWVTQEESR